MCFKLPISPMTINEMFMKEKKKMIKEGIPRAGYTSGIARYNQP